MTPRIFAAILCALAAQRWPRLWFVSGALVLEHVAPELVARTKDLAPLAWSSSSVITASVGSSFGTMPGRTACIVAVIHALALMFVPSALWQVATVCAASSVACVSLLRRSVPQDIERNIVLMLLAGNATTAALTIAIGIESAYAHDVVVVSNGITHLVVAGLVLWAIRSH